MSDEEAATYAATLPITVGCILELVAEQQKRTPQPDYGAASIEILQASGGDAMALSAAVAALAVAYRAKLKEAGL